MSTVDSLVSLMKDNDIKVADLEFIIKYLIQEKISPQLAMRQIKNFEQLKAKLEDNSLKDQVEELSIQITDKDNEISNLTNQINEIEMVKEDLESKTELLETELETLRNQLKALEEMYREPDEESNEENSLEKNIGIVNSTFEEISSEFEFAKPLFDFLNTLLDDLTKKDLTLEKSELETLLNNLKPKQVEEKITSEEKSQAIEPTNSNLTEGKTIQDRFRNEINKKPKITNKSDESDEEERKQKVAQILDLFLDFVREAQTDKEFKERVSAISDMEEAYIYLGSLGTSQLYSYATKNLDKREEIIKLIESWKANGVPR